MSVNNDTVINSIHQLENFLFHDDILNEIESHPLINLRDQLEKIDNQSHLTTTIDEKQKLMFTLNCFEMHYFHHFIEQYSSIIPYSILTALFDIIRFQMNLNMRINSSLIDYYFDLSLNYLISDSTIDYLINKKNIPSNIDEYFLKFFLALGSRTLYVRRSISYSIYVSHTIIPKFFQLNHSTERLLQAFITCLDDYFLNNYIKCQIYLPILKWLVNMTDIYGFVPYFIEMNYPNALLKWLSVKQNPIQNISLQSWFWILNLLHNIARHRTGVKILNKLKIIDTLKQWKEQLTDDLSVDDHDENDKDILVAYYLLYAILLEPKELKRESMSNIQTVLDYILERTILAFNSTDLYCGPYNVCEYLEGLAKFVVNDSFLNYIISCENIYELFVQKFISFNTTCESSELNTTICSSLYTIFWSISFLLEYNGKLRSNEKFLSLVEQRITYQSNNEHSANMKRAAKGILFNLDLDSQPIEEHQNNNDNQTKVMISYAHKDTKFCKELVAKLQERFQGDLWVDFNRLSPPYEDDWEEIAKAITRCDTILMIVTENYCSSKSCRREVIHADKRNKRMVPIYLDRDYKAEDWFEIRVGSATWVRFGGKKSNEEVLENLLELINVRDKIQVHDIESTILHESNPTSKLFFDEFPSEYHQTMKNSLPLQFDSITEIPEQPSFNTSMTSAFVSNCPIEEWTHEEVQQWLRLPPSILELSSGNALLTYMKLLSTRDAQYDEYEHRMRDRGISREEFSNLISSFTSISSLCNTKTTSTELPDRWTREEIKYWFERNRLSHSLFNTFNFVNGSQLITYGKLIIDSPLRLNEEYERLRNQIGKDFFHLDEYARLLSSLENLVKQSQLKDESTLCIIL